MTEPFLMGHVTEIIRRELPHLTPMVIDGAISVLCPTLICLKVGALALVKAGDTTFASWSILIICDCGVAALTALGGFRSKAFNTWREGKRDRDATDLLRKSQVDPEGHLK